MARSEEALANRLEVREAAYAPASAYNRLERQLPHLIREIEGELPQQPKEWAPAQLIPPRNEQLLRGYVFADAVALAVGFLFGWLLDIQVNSLLSTPYGLDALTGKHALFMAMQFLTIAVGTIMWFGHSSHYQLRMPFWMEAKKIVETMSFALLLSCFLQFVSKENYSRVWLMSCWVFSAVGIIALRSFMRSIWNRRGEWQIPTLVIGDGPTAEEACVALNSEPGLGYHPVARIKDLPTALHTTGNSWIRLCQAYCAQHVVIALTGDDFINTRPLLAQLMREHIPFSVAPPMHNLSVFGMEPQCFLGHDVMLLVRNSGLDRPLSRLIKRSFDVVFSAMSLLFFSPLMLLLAGVVKLDGGPAFYKHRRIGLNGEIFYCYKFRSMAVKNEALLRDYLAKHPAARTEWMRDRKLRHDPRITLVGRFLRRTSLDELPQLFNVIRGEMSIVGPRPIIVAEAVKYDNDIAFYYRVRPGMTGLWQVSGRNDVSYAERVRMDSWYVRNWSLWHDITIICKTFAVVIKQRGAY